MLCLAEQVGCDIPRIRSLICQNRDLTGAGDGIDPYESINCLLGQGNKDVSGPDDATLS